MEGEGKLMSLTKQLLALKDEKKEVNKELRERIKIVEEEIKKLTEGGN
jgi:cell division protein FtsB